jgi:hypothetical protein
VKISAVTIPVIRVTGTGGLGAAGGNEATGIPACTSSKDMGIGGSSESLIVAAKKGCCRNKSFRKLVTVHKKERSVRSVKGDHEQSLGKHSVALHVFLMKMRFIAVQNE